MTYVLPLRWSEDSGLEELTAYLRWLSRRVEVVVVDGSPSALRAGHAARWRSLVRHLPPDPVLRYANGKVNGVLTGLRVARHDRVVVADDDVRYDDTALRRMAQLLGHADVVRPQNYFDPLPWHARWDTGRSLLNRAVGADFPGTLGVRRSTVLGIGGYDGDVLFENLELIRTVRAHGGREIVAHGLYVRRLPPTARRFWAQRVRQAYDDLAQPRRFAVFLALLPAALVAARSGRWGAALAGALVTTVTLAEAGRRRAGGARVFPRSTVAFAPVWVLERATCAWLALARRVGWGGISYAGARIRVAAHRQRQLAG
ncbi:glycosyltransferase [Micromonospora fluostatini]|uniref:glycosyltransferase n=1 Tax=Micromonospora sp. JCM 30529 TaxID=3421643 RepID=UPI003D171F53